MICAHCGKAFNGGHPKHKKVEEQKKKSVMFCSQDCKKMYG
ncbi:MAG: hypothetical protein AB1324_08060 [Candidatus Micrarchaeota archaeon]